MAEIRTFLFMITFLFVYWHFSVCAWYCSGMALEKQHGWMETFWILQLCILASCFALILLG